MRPWLPDFLSHDQQCGLTKTTIYYALANIREVVVIAEVGRKTMFMISLDFKGAFHAVSHEILEEVLLKYGYRARMVRRIMGLYDGATSSIQVNGFISALIGIHASVRQGCHLSMILYAHVVNPSLKSYTTSSQMYASEGGHTPLPQLTQTM
jgi:hypothetical protein